jgi:plastocyanin
MPPGLKVGDTIVWVNRDTVIHSVTARDHSFDLRLNPGQSGKMTLTTAGHIAFYCLFHPNMRGSMTVAAK